MAGMPANNRARIAELCRWLDTTVREADTHFWNGILAEYRLTGAISAYIRNTADAMCDVEAVADQILQEFAEMLGQVHVPVDWSSNKTALRATAVGYASTRLNELATQALTQMGAPNPVTIREPFDDALDDLYAQASGIVNALGPKFASPLTAVYPNADAAMITAEVDAGGDLILTQKDSGGTATAWPTGAAWHQVAVGDLIYIESLAVTGFSAFVGQTYEIGSLTGTGVMKLPCGSAIIAPADSAVATEPGQIYRFRKVKGA